MAGVIPTCPACRADLAPDAHFCRRCGAAVRPTCPRCSEPIVGDHPFCPGCGAYVAGQWLAPVPLETPEPGQPPAPEPEPVRAVAPVVAPATEAAAAPAPVVAAPAVAAPPAVVVSPPVVATRRPPSRRRKRWPWSTRIVLLLLFVIAAFAAAQAWWEYEAQRGSLEEITEEPGSTAPAVRLAAARFAEAHFEIAYPDGWTVTRRPSGSRTLVSFVEPGAGEPERGLYVLPEDGNLDNARKAAEEVAKAVPGYRRLELRDALTSEGWPALEHRFTSEGSAFEQWWVASPGRVHRLTFWAPEADGAEASALFVRILGSFRPI